MTPANERALARFLRAQGLLESSELAVTPLPGGRSNLTYRVESAEGTWVLRKPPAGPLAPTAHDVLREYRLLEAMERGGYPAPRPLLACDDVTVVGTPFFLMTYVEGAILRDRAAAELLDPSARQNASEAAISMLARLHDLDHELCGLRPSRDPRPFLRRQIRRWSEQWSRWRIEGIAEMDNLAGELLAAAPAREDPAVVHGDYRFDNLVLGAGGDSVAAVLDWELATVGDPLADVGLLVAYWSDAGEPLFPHQELTGLDGFPSRDEVCSLYASRSGRDLARLPVYVAFGYFKWAAIRAGIDARYRSGSYTAADGPDMARSVAAIAAAGSRALRSAL